MKTSLQLFLFILFCNSIFAQSSWVKTPYLDIIGSSSLHYDSTSVGMLEVCTSPNKTMISILQINENHTTWIVAMDSSGKILWKKTGGVYAGTYKQNCSFIHPTKDNGCVYHFQHLGSLFIDTIFRLGSNGNVIWKKGYVNQIGFYDYICNVTQSCYNTTFIQFTDSLVELDSSGSYLRYRTPFSKTAKLIHAPDSDFIYLDSSVISKQDFNGNIRWSTVAPVLELAYADSSFIYAYSSTQVKKINTNDGTIIWTKSVNNQYLSETSDLGFVITHGSQVLKYDSSGTLEWTHSIPLPHFGLKRIAETSDKGFITGGCWNSYDLFDLDTFYCPLFVKVDSLGNGVCDSTHYFFNGNANDNYLLSFSDDAVYVAAAMGYSGPERDSLLNFNIPAQTVFGTDWSSGFGAGINYKYSDVDGNGLVDGTDLSALSALFSPQYPPHYNLTPHWLRTGQSVSPELKFLFENNTINYADTIKINIILASPSSPIDSIYGLSFDLMLNNVGTNGIQSFNTIRSTSFGNPLQNLYSYNFHSTSSFYKYSMVICRNDQTNAMVAGDTIATLKFLLPQNAFFSNPVSVNVNWNAITKEGFPVSLSLVTDTLYLSGTSGINNFIQNEIKIFPNPANDKLVFTFNTDNVNDLSIYDETGRNIQTIKNPGNKYILDVNDFEDGVYFASVLSENKISRLRFMVVH